MTASTPTTACPSCGAAAAGSFCSSCGASLTARSCANCRAELAPQARFCHRCGRPAAGRSVGDPRSERNAWIFAVAMCLLLVGTLVWKVSRERPRPVAPDMANPGSLASTGPADQAAQARPAPDISRMTPRERFDRLFNRIMQSAERGDSAEVARFTPMALGAYSQLESFDADARYHAAVLRLQVGDTEGALALADTILAQHPGHLFAYLIRGTAAELRRDPQALAQAERDFLGHYPAESTANRVEYLEHQPVIESFLRKARQSMPRAAGP